jgi:hypothetical protein
MGANGRRRMQQQYDWNVVMPQLTRHYAALVACGSVEPVVEGGYAID